MGKCKICGKPTVGNFLYCRDCYEKMQKEKDVKEVKKEEKKADGENHCEICGRPSGKYPLCFVHSKMIKTGEVVKCEKCGTWHLAKEACPKCGAAASTSATQAAPSVVSAPAVHVHTKVDDDDDDSEDRRTFKSRAHSIGDENGDVVYCLICGKPTKNGHHFCIECYKKYADKDLFLQISGCREAAVLAADYKSPKKCSDGHKVKSKTEREIDNYFYNHQYFHVYEPTLSLRVGDQVKDFKPDFCLPGRFPEQPAGFKQNLYLEHLGLWNTGTKNYDEEAKGKARIYKDNGVTVIFTYEDQMDDIDGILDRDLGIVRYGDILNDPNTRG